LGGLWWDIREEFVAHYGAAVGVKAARDLFVNWAMVTNGGMGLQSAHPHLVREILVVNNNGGPPNTAPDYSRICAAALKHGLAIAQVPSGTCVVKTLAITKPLLSFQAPFVTYSSSGSCAAGGIDPFPQAPAPAGRTREFPCPAGLAVLAMPPYLRSASRLPHVARLANLGYLATNQDGLHDLDGLGGVVGVRVVCRG
jgi:hypothetical protein